MTTVFALSGGGNLGAVQVGMLIALEEVGITPDVIVGTSVGAVNGAWLAGRSDDAELADLVEIWTGLRRSDVFPFRPSRGMAALVGKTNHCVPNDRLRLLLEEHITFGRIEEARIPLHVVAADLLRGESVLLSRGPTVDAVLASSAIPGIYPAVDLDGRSLVDGGIIEGTPISQAVEVGATTVWALPTGFSCGLSAAPMGALATIFHAVGVLGAQQLARDIEIYRGRVDLRVVPPPCPINLWAHDFSQGLALIEQAYEQTAAWLESGAAEVRGALVGLPAR